MVIINVKKIDFVIPKDIIEVASMRDLKEVNVRLFSEGVIFKVDKDYYLIGNEVAYIYKSKK